jgi:hypothetical protein
MIDDRAEQMRRACIERLKELSRQALAKSEEPGLPSDERKRQRGAAVGLLAGASALSAVTLPEEAPAAEIVP